MSDRRSGTTYHPRPNDHGKTVEIRHPGAPSSPETWQDPDAVAVFLPDGPVPPVLNGVRVSPVQPQSGPAGWATLVKPSSPANVPPPFPKTWKKPAAGAVIVEPDGRVWLCEPTNHFAGYQGTFPKGTQDDGYSFAATAAKEVFEETGLLVEIGAFLIDSDRGQSLTRFFLARRTGGSPSAMGWETQAVCLVPMAQLRTFVPHGNDASVVQAVLKVDPSYLEH